MTRTALIIAITIGIFLAGSCIDPYNPPEIKSSEPYLIVDGLVDVNSEDAHVVLIHSQALDEEGAPLRESNATVSILVNGSQTYMLSETAPGEYVAAGLLINPGDQCQLRIQTTSGQEFLSEVVTSKETPAIDSITWTAHPDHLDIEVNTHDPTGSTLYYRWKYEQTVMYRSVHPSSYIWDEELQEIRSRNLDEKIYECWKTTPSSAINVFSSKGLSEDIVSRHIITTFSSRAWELRTKYSILVKQFAIGEDEFNFWTELKKSTESIGTIFDPQPSQIAGNIYAVNPSGQNVFGYFSVGASTEKRIFIDYHQLPYKASEYETGYPGCGFMVKDTLRTFDFLSGTKRELLIDGIYDGPFLIGYWTAESRCIDCRIAHGGINRKPDFWE